MSGLCPRQIGVEIFERQRELIVVESFGASTELPTLQALDDETEPLDLSMRGDQLCIVTGDLRGELAHEQMQSINVDRQRAEIQNHARQVNVCGTQNPRRRLS